MNRDALKRTILLRFSGGVALLGALFFGTAGKFRYWEAWAYLATLFLPVALVAFLLLRDDPALLERRMAFREERPRQRAVVKVATLFWLAVFLIPGLRAPDMANSSLGRYGGGRRPFCRVRGVHPDNGGPETVLPAGSVICRLGLEARQEEERRSSVCELRTEPAPLCQWVSASVSGAQKLHRTGARSGPKRGFAQVTLQSEGG